MNSLPKLDELLARGEVFDGVRRSYVPGAKLKIDPSLVLHTEVDDRLDAITYEVIRHNLWNINEEHGSTIQRISGSPVAMYAIDLNPSILTEDAEFVYFGPFMQYMSGVTDVQVKWVLEHRSGNPGIHDGDMFIANDPWVGAAHQQDVMLMCPVFHEGRLFCWTTNCLHQHDVGGISPGSFCGQARDAFDEGRLLPPIKIMERGEVRRDVEELYLRSSRAPNMVALDLRAQIAGNRASAERIKKLIQRYGAATVKGVMKRVIANAEAAFLAKMKSLPDGVWQERTYVECASMGDRGVYPSVVTVRKQGTELTFENEGTSAQGGAMNCTYAGWRGSIMVVLNQVLCWDQYFAIGGALRHVKFNPTPGTFTCANYPAAVSTAPIQAMEIALYPVYNVLAKMVYPDPKLRPDILCMSGTSQWPATMFQGIDQHGEVFGSGMVDPIGGAIGAFAVADGISTGGQARTPISRMPNVEHSEHLYPMLYVYRKEVVDSGGAGRYRGGQGAEVCYVPHNTQQMTVDIIASGVGIPSSMGMMGGSPSAPNIYRYRRDSDILQRFQARRMPGDIDEVAGEKVEFPARQNGIVQKPSDVYAVSWCGGGGFGDPYQRDVALVQSDLDGCIVSPAAAERDYGVVIDAATGLIDAAASQAQRQARRRERAQALGGGTPRPRAGQPLFDLSPSVALHRAGNGELFHVCRDCGHDLGPASDNVKDHALRDDRPMTDGTPLACDPKRYVDEPMAFRQYLCPGCGGLLDNEIAPVAAPALHDMHIVQLPGLADAFDPAAAAQE